jgi:acetyl-CoA C-acetyltransferase
VAIDNTPVLVGAGTFTQRDVEPADAFGPMDLAREAALRAANDADVGETIWPKLDSVRVVRVLSGGYPDAAALLAERLRVGRAETMVSDTGGNSPQALVNRTAEDLAAGRIGSALLCGGEVLHSMVQALSAGTPPKWMARDGVEPSVGPVDFSGTADYEVPYEFQRPVNVYPLFENALRAQYGHSIAEHQQLLGEMCSRMTEVAAANPDAWFPIARTPEEIATPTPKNRYIGFPYTKFMNAMIRVDQAAAVLMTTVAAAKSLGIPESRWVYLHGCADAHDHWHVSEREHYHGSPAIKICARESLAMAGWDIADVAHIDLYSCFPSAVQIGRDAFGIPADDERPLTVTGGLPYHGGPANNYAMHSIATMLHKLRDDPGSKGLVSALGWYVTKHAVGLYGTEPIEHEWECKDPKTYQSEIDDRPKPAFTIEAKGPATIETYTVLHGHDGPETGIVVGRLEDGTRFLAKTPADADTFNELMTQEGVGRTGNVANASGINEFQLA